MELREILRLAFYIFGGGTGLGFLAWTIAYRKKIHRWLLDNVASGVYRIERKD